MKTKLSGTSCPFPGSLPHGNWTCKMQEIQIRGTSFLDENAQSYRGKFGYQERIPKAGVNKKPSVLHFQSFRSKYQTYLFVSNLSQSKCYIHLR